MKNGCGSSSWGKKKKPKNLELVTCLEGIVKSRIERILAEATILECQINKVQWDEGAVRVEELRVTPKLWLDLKDRW